MDVPDEGVNFCLECAKRETCQRVCKPLEDFLKAECGTVCSVPARAFTDLPGHVRHELAIELYGTPTALDRRRSFKCG